MSLRGADCARLLIRATKRQIINEVRREAGLPLVSDR
jgi:hypothetical protein